MSEVHAEAGYLRVSFHDDDETPVEFVVELLHSVFKKPIFDAMRLVDVVKSYGDAVCDVYPRDVGNELLEAARQRIRDSAHPLRITSKAVASSGKEELERRCKLCGTLSRTNRIFLKGNLTLI
jgi:ATP-dependent Clp protease adapter protein ClpS